MCDPHDIEVEIRSYKLSTSVKEFKYILLKTVQFCLTYSLHFMYYYEVIIIY